MNTKNQLTAEGLESLKKELEDIYKIKIPQIRKRLDEAREGGDLSENSAWTMAQDEYENARTRATELEEILKNSTVVVSCSTKSVNIGSYLTLEINGTTSKYLLVSSKEANPIENKISIDSPIGKAIFGKVKGDKVQYINPSGDKIEVIIKDISCEA